MNDAVPAPDGRGDAMTTQIEPGALLKQIGWVEMRLTQINLRTEAARRFAAYALDRWEGTSDLPELDQIVRPRSVAAHQAAALYERYVQELEGRLTVLTQRVHGLLIYRDRVRGFEPLTKKRQWLETHGGTRSCDEATISDELGSAELHSAADEIDSQTRKAMTILLQDAERLSKM